MGKIVAVRIFCLTWFKDPLLLDPHSPSRSKSESCVGLSTNGLLPAAGLSVHFLC